VVPPLPGCDIEAFPPQADIAPINTTNIATRAVTARGGDSLTIQFLDIPSYYVRAARNGSRA
jgi:hypothetical protein